MKSLVKVSRSVGSDDLAKYQQWMADFGSA